jgi:hypothetical protein
MMQRYRRPADLAAETANLKNQIANLDALRDALKEVRAALRTHQRKFENSELNLPPRRGRGVCSADGEVIPFRKP